MASYLVEIIDRLIPKSRSTVDLDSDRILLQELAAELDRLDPRDFEFSQQGEFVVLKAQTKAFCLLRRGNMPMILRKLKQVLASYGGLGSHLRSRQFAYVADETIRSLLERDYRELSAGLLPSRSWKSSVIMAGSVLEAVLYGVLTRNERTISRANNAAQAPKRGNKTLSITDGNWTLSSLLRVATELAIIPESRAKTVDQVVRDYRNFVHPQKEIRAKHSCGEAEALLAKGGLDAICGHLDSTVPPIMPTTINAK